MTFKLTIRQDLSILGHLVPQDTHMIHLVKTENTSRKELKELHFLHRLKKEIQTSSKTMGEMRNFTRRQRLYWTWERQMAILK